MNFIWSYWALQLELVSRHSINVLDSIALAVMGASYAIDTTRGHQLLAILEAILPAYLRHLQTSAGRKDPRTERDILHQIGVAVKTLINNAEALTKLVHHPLSTDSIVRRPRSMVSELCMEVLDQPRTSEWDQTFTRTVSGRFGKEQ